MWGMKTTTLVIAVLGHIKKRMEKYIKANLGTIQIKDL